jgi:hypothetical protein
MKKVLLVLLILVMGTLSFAKGKTRKSGGHKAKSCTSDKIILNYKNDTVTYCSNGKKIVERSQGTGIDGDDWQVDEVDGVSMFDESNPRLIIIR